MRLNKQHFTYCTNIHPSSGLEEVTASLERYAVPLKANFAPDKPFGIGLRLSGQESCEVLENDNLAHFKTFLDERGLYVFTINGFPYGPFHGQAVKENVHAPDWRDEERVRYTLRLVQILEHLLPSGVTGGISTSPLSYKAWVDGSTEMWKTLTDNVVRVAEELYRVKERGRVIHLDLEPEPDGLLENSEEVMRFYQDWLLDYGAKRLNITEDEAREVLLAHIQICFDTCHVALAYEEPRDVLQRFEEVGIKVGKIQISSALKVDLPRDKGEREEVANNLRAFVEPTYLHQVLQKNEDGTLTQYPDLPDALPHIQDTRATEWRVHFHVPIFTEHFSALSSTQEGIVKTLELLKEEPFTEHLEIETYTWDVLPETLKVNLLESIEREYRWALNAF